ncbi:MAG: transposase [Phycisphaeraceae bacterium]|nr:transposase [Phycisphaeraceae bacterium]
MELRAGLHRVKYPDFVVDQLPHRKQMRRREVPSGVRFVTFSCQNRLPLLRNEKIARLFVASLARARAELGFVLFAWVVMPEHVHLLCRPPEGMTLDRVLVRLKMTVARRVLARWKEMNAPILTRLHDATGRSRFWLKGGGFDRNVRDDAEFSREVRYIHRNPVERGLVDNPQDWPWSSIRWWMGLKEGELECDPPPGRPGSWELWKGYA